MSESFINAPPLVTDEDTVYTMGGLGGLPSDIESSLPNLQAGIDNQFVQSLPEYQLRDYPTMDPLSFIGTPVQIAQMYPGVQQRPVAAPGLTDLTFTRGYYGPGSDVVAPGYGTESAGTLFWQGGVGREYTPQPQEPGPVTPQPQPNYDEAILQAALGMDWSGAYQDYLNKLQAQSQDINISNVFTPTNTFTPTFNPSNVFNPTVDTDIDIGGGAFSPSFSPSYSPSFNPSYSPSTTVSPNINVSQSQTQTQTQQQQQQQGGGGTQTQSGDTQGQTGGGGGGGGAGGGGGLSDLIGGGGGLTDSDLSDFIDEGLSEGRTLDQITNDLIGSSKLAPGTTLRENDDGTISIIPPSSGGALDSLPFDGTIGGGTDTSTIDLGTWENQDTLGGGDQTDYVPPTTGPDETGYVPPTTPSNPYEQQVADAYQQLFGRAPDPEGLQYWSNQLAQGATPAQLLRDMASGAQGDDAAFLRNTDTVKNLYQNLLGRAPDAEGLSYYRSQLAAGATPEDVARNLISGAQGSDVGEISQAERERYFPPAPTQQPTTGTSSNAVNNIFTVTSKNIETANELSRLAQDFVNSQSLDPNLMPDQVRDSFIREIVGTRPDLLGDIINDPRYQTVGAEGMTGINTGQLISDLGSAIDSEAYAALNDLIGEAGGSLGEVVGGILAGDNLSEIGGNVVASLAVSAAVDAGAAALASLGIPGAGPFIAGALALDSVLSNALGYDSPIQDGISFIADMTERGLDWLQDTFGGLFESVGDFFGDIGGWFGDWFAEGGLVDLPGDSMYNANTQGVLPDIEGYARGGVIPLPGGGKIARGPGGGLDDLIPTSIDGRRAAALSDGEFVIPADVVSMMGDGSTNAGSKRLYDLVRQIRQEKTGTSRQAGPLPVGKILERTMR